MFHNHWISIRKVRIKVQLIIIWIPFSNINGIWSSLIDTVYYYSSSSKQTGALQYLPNSWCRTDTLRSLWRKHSLHDMYTHTVYRRSWSFSWIEFKHSRRFTLIVPKVFHTRKFTQKSDVHSFGIIRHLIATGESHSRGWQFDRLGNIMDGMRPSMPDSAPRKLLIRISVQMQRDLGILFADLLKRWKRIIIWTTCGITHY